MKKLRRVPGDKIVDLMNEVYHSVPQISAAGFLNINLNLIPMVKLIIFIKFNKTNFFFSNSF